MSSFITPITNRRTDEYGGRSKTACASRWKSFMPCGKCGGRKAHFRAHFGARLDCPRGRAASGRRRDRAIAREAGVDLIDVSAGQTSTRARPVYGRMFQTPFSDRIRNEAGVATLAVGNIYEPDHVNSILMAGRADLVCLARPHLSDPYWTLHAAADLRYDGVRWPKPYWPGRDQLSRLKSRNEALTGKV
jgi:anthraniloyl-CoA monooxygenase